METKEFKAFGKTVLRNNRIGVQEQNKISCGGFQTPVACFSKPKVNVAVDEIDLLKKRPQVIQAAIRGIVIHNNHFRIKALNCFPDSKQALFQEKLYVVVYYDNG
jgi:hypothetical protein